MLTRRGTLASVGGATASLALGIRPGFTQGWEAAAVAAAAALVKQVATNYINKLSGQVSFSKSDQQTLNQINAKLDIISAKIDALPGVISELLNRDRIAHIQASINSEYDITYSQIAAVHGSRGATKAGFIAALQVQMQKITEGVDVLTDYSPSTYPSVALGILILIGCAKASGRKSAFSGLIATRIDNLEVATQSPSTPTSFKSLGDRARADERRLTKILDGMDHTGDYEIKTTVAAAHPMGGEISITHTFWTHGTMSPTSGLPDPAVGFRIINSGSGDVGHLMPGVPAVDGDHGAEAEAYFNAKALEIRNAQDRAQGADKFLEDSKNVIAILRKAAV